MNLKATFLAVMTAFSSSAYAQEGVLLPPLTLNGSDDVVEEPNPADDVDHFVCVKNIQGVETEEKKLAAIFEKQANYKESSEPNQLFPHGQSIDERNYASDFPQVISLAEGVILNRINAKSDYRRQVMQKQFDEFIRAAMELAEGEETCPLEIS